MFSQELECSVQPEKLHCWVAINLWERLVPDFRPKNLELDFPEVNADPTKNHTQIYKNLHKPLEILVYRTQNI